MLVYRRVLPSVFAWKHFFGEHAPLAMLNSHHFSAWPCLEVGTIIFLQGLVVFCHPFEKICLSNWKSSPNRGENKQMSCHHLDKPSELFQNFCYLGGGFNFFLFSPLFGEDFQLSHHLSHEKNPPTFHYTSWF